MKKNAKARIPLIKPNLSFAEFVKLAKTSFETGILTKGPYVQQFERDITRYIGTKHAFSTTSATTALHLSLVAMGIQKGDEVLVADFTFPATANVVVQTGATPILVDIDLDTFNINLQDLKRKITSKSKAIIFVDAFGNPADITELKKLSKEYNLKLIEDAACAIGAKFDGIMSGKGADVGCFSFHPRKSITTGEGGIITTDNDILAEKISILRNHGGVFDENLGYFKFIEAGFNYRMSELQAIMGIIQLKKINTIINKRKKIVTNYFSELCNEPDIILPNHKATAEHTYQSFVVLLNKKINRNKVILDLKNNNIETTIGTYALHAQPFFSGHYGYHPGDLVNSYYAFNQSITLPLYDRLRKEDIKHICFCLKQAIVKSKE